MSDDALSRVVAWLRCPHCGEALTPAGGALHCAAGHSFDVARQGYVNLFGRSAPRNADTVEMLAARQRFLAGGWYQPIATALGEHLTGASRIIEVGAGSAYYLAHALPERAYGLATDISVPACRRAAKAHPRVAAVVADTWAGLPVATGALDAVLCVFAPRNPAEFGRILAPGGRLIIVAPEPEHLQLLRTRDSLLRIGDGKQQEILAAFGGWSQLEHDVVSYDIDLTAEAAADLVAMGPNAFHGVRSSGAIRTRVAVRIWRCEAS